MKTVSFLVIVGAFSLGACAQNTKTSEAPALVKNAFIAQYPKAADVEWENKGSYYEVEFETGLHRMDHKMFIDSTGKIIFHKQEISQSELPAQVKATLDNNFPGYTLDDIKKTEKEGVITFTVEVKKAKEEWKLTLDQEGKILDKIPD